MEKASKSRLSAVLIFAVTFAIAFFGTKYLFSGNSDDAKLKEIAAQINKSCPVVVDSETRLDNTEAFDGAKIQYNYTLLNVTKGDSTVNISDTKKFIEGQSQQNLDTNPQMHAFREMDITMKYHYKDKNGQFLFDFTIKPKNK